MDYKMHDVVAVKRTHKDPDKTYYGGTTRGVIVSFDENSVSIKNPFGLVEDFKLGEEGDYTVTVNPFSEIEYKEEIIRAVESKKKDLERIERDLKDVTEWFHIFTNEISFFEKIIRFASKK